MNDPIIIDRKSVITVRLDREIHDRLMDIAAHRGRSLNTLCRDLLGHYAEAYVETVKEPKDGVQAWAK